MRQKIRKVIRQIRAHQFGQPAPEFLSFDPGFRRRAHAPPCIR